MTTPRCLVVALLLTLPTPVIGQGSRWQRQVDAKLARANGTLARNGYAPLSTPWGGELDNGDTTAITLSLNPGEAYAVVGVCDDDCAGLDLQLFAANGYEVDAANNAGGTPIVRVTPREPTAYRLVVRMTGCGMNPCWFGVVTSQRRNDASPW